MSILGTIMSAIFGQAQGKAPTAQASPQGQQSSPRGAQSTAGTQSQAAGTKVPFAPQAVDVEPILDKLTAQKQQKLDWRHSIVDLMKALDLDSSLSARKELATELHYSGDTNDSAAMNIWLHKQVMAKLAENGGRVPDSLKH